VLCPKGKTETEAKHGPVHTFSIVFVCWHCSRENYESVDISLLVPRNLHCRHNESSMGGIQESTRVAPAQSRIAMVQNIDKEMELHQPALAGANSPVPSLLSSPPAQPSPYQYPTNAKQPVILGLSGTPYYSPIAAVNYYSEPCVLPIPMPIGATATATQKNSNRKKRTWEESFAAVLEYREKTGTCEVPRRVDQSLSRWVKRQRTNPSLSTEQRRRLIEIGVFPREEHVDVGKHEAQWNEMFDLLKAHKKKHGTTCVKQSRTYSPLASWVCAQRASYASGKLGEGRVEKLNSIGFVWKHENGKNTEQWNEMFEYLKSYKQKFGTASVIKNTRHRFLSKWSTRQRQAYASGKLNKRRVDKLNSIGFVWSLRASMQRKAEKNGKFKTSTSSVPAPPEPLKKRISRVDDKDMTDSSQNLSAVSQHNNNHSSLPLATKKRATVSFKQDREEEGTKRLSSSQKITTAKKKKREEKTHKRTAEKLDMDLYFNSNDAKRRKMCSLVALVEAVTRTGDDEFCKAAMEPILYESDDDLPYFFI